MTETIGTIGIIGTAVAAALVALEVSAAEILEEALAASEEVPEAEELRGIFKKFQITEYK